MRVALVHDYLTQFGGAERVLLALMELFPHAPLFTLLYDRSGLGVSLDESRIRTSFLQQIPGAKRHYRYFSLFMPLAAEQFDFSQFDVVLSVTHSFGKGVVVSPHTLHLSYCFTPVRYVWDDSHRYVREFSTSTFFQRFAAPALSYIRLWDYYASQRSDAYITISEYVARRIRKYYGCDAAVVPPPVDVDRFTVREDDDGYYLIVSRLVPYKRLDVAIAACEQLGRRLYIVGTGPEEDVLRRRAGKHTFFLGFVSDSQLARLYGGARALLFPQEEDFGITPLEAAASGKPTVAYRAGGALETIIDGLTGVFFDYQTVSSLTSGLQRFERRHWNTWAIRRHAELFRREVFLQRMHDAVHNQWDMFQARGVHRAGGARDTVFP